MTHCEKVAQIQIAVRDGLASVNDEERLWSPRAALPRPAHDADTLLSADPFHDRFP